ncbi:hypothetical protein C812_02116 [Paenibacillus barengoltzii G22]|uniref:Uncharacterized protein n=1 Tax=Paenibacillus barengoltzii G22 TaxID=1235795 RepID=R9LB93_9BACL|nr:hypothetical protein C812_02116 [Paenibacillus barengoltzii G22]
MKDSIQADPSHRLHQRMKVKYNLDKVIYGQIKEEWNPGL